MLLLALPNLATSLQAGSNEQLWATDIYGFLLAGFLVTMGTLGDRIGRRRLLLIGGVAFAIGSLLCAYAPTIELLIAARALLGIAGATLMPSTLALIGTLFQNPKQQAAAFGIWGGTFTLGAVFGPVLGGVMLEHFWWGSVFLLGVPFMVALVVLGPAFLPEFRNPQPGKLDLTSVVLSLVALLPLIYGIKELARAGFEPLPTVSLVVGIVVGYLFVRRQRHLADPMLDLNLFTNRTIGTTLINQLTFSLVGGGFMMMMLLYFQLVGGMTTVQAGAAMVPGMLTAAVGMQIAPRLANKIRPGLLISVGVALAAITYVVVTQVGTDSNMTIIVGFALISFFGAPTVALGTGLVVGSAPVEKMGAAGSLAQLANEFGSTLGLAILGTVGAAVYRSTVTLPGDLPADSAAQAGDSIAGATAVAGDLPAGQGEGLVTAAKDAFVDGFQTVAVIGAVLYACAALMVAIRLRHVPAFGAAAAAPAPEKESESKESEPEVV
ncbi:DHA2 family multidrug resistance protein-like MFS transporter [Actinophytocola algeriensis]|uniref:DHA2 family multidrug resistance protein-like MFS transporter n=1 Tax=Actinophytocola algeriensis TaxID=1768010 RepID=A0A7W7Q976_9PSEU|nr:DHA2 family multidrug resistance protein-like MFS transporter [Actinophytocola algeriensis]MBE1475367.1 DHA2 family multidrug resistance protein-like MFS transporter [Actinophytocola algeriensis]